MIFEIFVNKRFKNFLLYGSYTENQNAEKVHKLFGLMCIALSMKILH